MAIEIIGTLKQKNNGEFGLIDSNDIIGGFYQADTLDERNSIPFTRRKEGMFCWVGSNVNKVFQLVGGITNDCWIEDCAIAAVSMQYQAEELGLGSCWAQMRGRGLSDGTLAEDVIRGILDIPENFGVLCVLGFGHKEKERKPQDEDALKWENVHIDKF